MVKMRKKIIALVASVLIIICLALALYFYLNPPEMKVESALEAEKYINEVNSLIIKGSSKKRIKKVLKFDLECELIMVGKDAYQRKRPADEIIQKYDLNSYAFEAERLSSNLEEKIKDNYSVKTIKTSKENNFYVSKINYQTFYYAAYVGDLKSLETEILAKTGLHYDDKSEKDEEIANKYKAKVKAMQILDKHLDNYINKNEKLSFDLYLMEGKSSQSKNEVKGYLYGILGYNYEKFELYNVTRINGYENEIDDKGLNL